MVTGDQQFYTRKTGNYTQGLINQKGPRKNQRLAENPIINASILLHDKDTKKSTIRHNNHTLLSSLMTPWIHVEK